MRFNYQTTVEKPRKILSSKLATPTSQYTEVKRQLNCNVFGRVYGFQVHLPRSVFLQGRRRRARSGTFVVSLPPVKADAFICFNLKFANSIKLRSVFVKRKQIKQEEGKKFWNEEETIVIGEQRTRTSEAFRRSKKETTK